MSMSTLLTIGVRSMNASYAALEVTGHNIANASTPGYSRQQVELGTGFSQRTANGFFGKGVDVQTVTRAHGDFLTREAAASQSLSAADAARRDSLQQLEQVFRTGENGLGYQSQQVFNAFADVAAKPQDPAARQTVLARVADLAAGFRSAQEQLDSMQRGVADQVRTAVGEVNTLSRQIAELNRRIALVAGGGHTPNDLLDQRDQAVSELSKRVQVSTVEAEDGTMAVFMSGSQRLVLGVEATPLAVGVDPYDPSKVALGVADGSVVRSFPAGFVSGGSVAGLLRFQNEDIGTARGLIGQLASAITGAVNAQQALGLDQRVPPGAGSPLLSIAAPSVAPSSANAMSGGVPVASYIDGSGARVSSVSIATVDSSQLQASDYELFADPALPAGQYSLTRLADGRTQTVTSGQVVDGFRIDVATPLPASRDHFLLQPVSKAASQMARALDDARGLAAASPVAATLGAGNTGTATVASLAAVDPSINPNLTATITFTDDLGHYSWSLVDTTATLPTTTGTGTYSANAPIALNGFELRLSGVPKTGDTVGVAKTAFPAGDNGNANAMLALRDAGLVGKQVVGPVTVPGMTTTEAYASAIGTVGVRVQNATSVAEQSALVASDARSALSNSTGVNLDEEAARLIQFQQAYQASARVLQVAQNIFDSLLGVK